METMISSSSITKKRKQTSNPFEGIFTRSKSQIYNHPNRSGHSRSDVIHRRHHYKSLDVLPLDSPFLDDNNTRTSVKDLRAKRVFSPALITDENGVSEKIEADFDVKSCIEEKGVGFLENIGDFSGNGDTNLSNYCAKTTREELEVDCNVVNKESGGNNVSICKGQGEGSLRSRRRVYKAPSSFSYRRLLPYLMDMTQDDSCVSQIEIVDLARSSDANRLADLVPKIGVNRDITVADKDQETGGQFDGNPVVPNETFHSTDALKIPNDNHVNSKVVAAQDDSMEERRENQEPNNLVEEFEQMTPPDSDVFGRAQVNDSFAQRGEKITLNGNLSDITRKAGGIVENLEEQKSNFIPKPRRVLNPCARMKLLKTPNSVSYRRLLPFLMDIAKDDSSTLKVDQPPKDEKDFKQKPLSLPLDSHDHDTTVGKSESENDSRNNSENQNSCTPTPSSVPTESDGSSDETTHALMVDKINSADGNSNTTEPSVVETPNSIDLYIPTVPELEVKLQLENSVEDSTGKSEKESDPEAKPSSSMCSTADNEIIPSGCALGISGKFEVDVKDDIVGLETPTDKRKLTTPRRGILKRYPPGCKGICDCLNCASFRLHAERAFEFSKNQMLSAEELALELIDELTCLRSILQTSAVDGNNLVLKGDQVKEVCSKSLQTEELAKQRIAQMNEDLSIHCRKPALERPRVSFSRNVEQKVIAKVNFSQK